MYFWKKMKKAIFLLIIALCSTGIFGQKLTIVEGTLEGENQEKTVTLENFINPTSFSLTANIANNKFVFQFNLDKENIFRLKFPSGNFYALILKPGEKVYIKIQANKNMRTFPEIVGSDQSQKIYFLESQLAKYKHQQDSINQVYSALAPDQNEIRQKLTQLYYKIENDKNNFLANALGQQPQDLANLFFIDRLNMDQYYPVYAIVDSLLFQKYNYISAVVSLHDKVQAAKKTAIGMKAPNIELPTPEGKLLSLYSIQGKMIIVDFWASWCGPCRRENPNLVKVYQQFKDKGLAIFGVSLDSDSLSWVKAIQADGLTWYHVSDLKKWKSQAAKLYGVNSIPANFILDENKTIIAKNLRGQQLMQFISQHLK